MTSPFAAGCKARLISADQCRAIGRDGHLVLLDCRHNPHDVEDGYRAFRRQHCPGSCHVRLDRDLAGSRNGDNGRNPLPDPQTFHAFLQAQGIRRDSIVVAYDDSSQLYASRLWWTAKWLGYSQFYLLDGGWPSAQGLSASTATEASGLPLPPPAPGLQNHVDMADVRRIAGRDDYLILDARPHKRYLGFDEDQDPLGGHIRGALSVPYSQNFDARGRFKPPQELRTLYQQILGEVPAANVIHQCGSGVSACVNLFAMELAGLTGSRLYPGSWSEWCLHPENPMFVRTKDSCNPQPA